MLCLSPLEQFVIITVFGSFNSFFLFTVPIVLIIFILTDRNIINQLSLSGYKNSVVQSLHNFWQMFNSYLYNSGSSYSFFFNFIFVIVITYILLSNVLGLLPWGFTLTSHLIIAFFLALSGFGWLNTVFVLRFPIKFASIFLPGGTPFAIVFIIIPIEILSYVSRVLSLSIRLFANMMSGHTLLHILSGFIFAALSINWLFLIPITIINIILFVEVGVAFLQVYVFVTLLNLYVNDTVSPDAH